MDRVEKIHNEIEQEKNDGIPEAVRCESCDSMVARGLTNCQICGAPVRDNLRPARHLTQAGNRLPSVL